MATIAKLMVELGLEDNAFQRGIRGAQDRLDAFGSSARRWGAGLTPFPTPPKPSGYDPRVMKYRGTP